MEQIINKLDEINKRLEAIEAKLNIINDSTSNMDNHIQFVEDVYDKIKQPLSYAANKINYYIGSNSAELPQLASSDTNHN